MLFWSRPERSQLLHRKGRCRKSNTGRREKEKIKEGAETVGEKTKEAAETVGEKTKETTETVAKKTKETVTGEKTASYWTAHRKSTKTSKRAKAQSIEEQSTNRESNTPRPAPSVH